jgi:ectoine hydroxylase-related dioxygenase (phytanoyl-CoA dioxygenase family)
MHAVMNRRRLGAEEVGVRYLQQSIPMLPPHEPDCPRSYHQDVAMANRTDRSGSATVWIALDEVLPEQGAMRFLTGSHREGPLGNYGAQIGQDLGVLHHYPKLLELYEWSPPFHYMPGDATIHHCYTVHGTPENRTANPRWSYIASYAPADNTVVSGPPGDIVYP